MKRFTATEKWAKAWFRKLPPRLKCLWLFFCDNVDHAGVIEIDWELASFQIGEPVSEEDLSAFGDRIQRINDGKLWLLKFVEFQYGKLSILCKPHAPVFAALKKHGINITSNAVDQSSLEDECCPNIKATGKPIEGYGIGYVRLQEKEKVQEKDKEQDKEKEGGGGGIVNLTEAQQNTRTAAHSKARIVLATLNELTGSTFRESAACIDPISDRIAETQDFDGIMRMLRRQVAVWKPDPEMKKHLWPGTLFGDKFDRYYGQRDDPLPQAPTRNGQQSPAERRAAQRAREFPEPPMEPPILNRPDYYKNLPKPKT